jgi:hypothetical protein
MSDLRLNNAQEALLARLAEATGRSQTDILDEALTNLARERGERDQWINAQMTALAEVWDNDGALASPLTPEERADLDRRNADLESGEVQGVMLDELKRSLLNGR